MSVQKILYEDKETFQTSPLDEVNKATSANYNEIKDVVNFNADELDSIVEGVWVPALTTGDVSAVQNTATSDISAQTGTKTFTGLDWDITTAGRTSTGDVNFFNLKKDTVSKFKVDIDGNITAAADTDATTILGRTRFDSRSTDHATFSHVDQTAGSAYALRQSSIGDTNLNAPGGRAVKLLTGANVRWTIDGNTGDLIASTGIDLNLSTTSALQWGGIDSITGDGTGDVTIPNGKFNTTASTTLAAINVGSFAGDPSSLVDGDYWTNSTTNKLRARENGVSVNVIGGGVLEASIQLTQSQIQGLSVTPIEIVPAPGAGKYVEVISSSASYNFTTAAFSGTDRLQLVVGTNIQADTSSTTFITSGVDVQLLLSKNASQIGVNTSLRATSNAVISGGNAASIIDVYVQYIIRDAN